MNHRYPTRALTVTSGEQLLQKRTRSQIQKPEGKAGAKQDNQASNSKKMRTQDFNDMTTQLQQQISYVEQMNSSANKKYQRALQKTNPRMAHNQMINPRQGKQLFKDQQTPFMAQPSSTTQQNQFMHQTPQLMNMNPYGMQMPMMYHQMPQMAPQMPQMVSGAVNPFDMTSQLQEMQKQLMNLQSMAIQSQMQQLQNPYMMMNQNMYQSGMMQDDPNEESIDSQQKQTPKQLKDDSKPGKRKSQSPSLKSAKNTPQQTKSKSPESKHSPSKQGQNKAKKGVAQIFQKKAENVTAQSKNTRLSKMQEKAKNAPKSTGQKKSQSPKKDEGSKTPTRLNRAQLEKQTSNKSSPVAKSKISSVGSIKEDESQPRRLTRHQKNDIEKKSTKKQDLKKISPIKQKETSTQRTLRSQQTLKNEKPSKPKKISPVRTSPRKTVAKHTRSNYVDLDSTPIRQTRLRAKVENHSRQNKEQRVTTTKAQSEHGAVDRSNVSSTQEQSNILKSLQKEVIMAAQQHQNTIVDRRDKSKLNKSGSRSSERKNKSPTKDEIMLFGESSFQNQNKQSLQENPLISKSSKFEAQTEIVVGKTDNFEQVFTDDEEEQEMKAQLAKERLFLQKGREQIKKIEEQLVPQDKLKDMCQLFGMPESEVIELDVKQRDKIQKIKDEQKLFGQSSDELPAVIEQFDENKKVVINDQEQIKLESQTKSNKEDELMLFDEQPSGSSNTNKNQPAHESQVSEKMQDKSSEKINVFSQPKNNDEALLFGSQQKQQIMQQDESIAENTKSFEIEVQQNSPTDSKPVSSEVTKQQQYDSQQNEYLRKQEELDRQIAEIKRQIEAQQTNQANIVQELSQPVVPEAPQIVESQAVEQIEDDHEMVLESQDFKNVDQEYAQEYKQTEEQAQEEQVSDSDIQEIPKQDVQIESQVEHRHFKESLQLSEKLSLLYEFQGTLDQSLNMALIRSMSSTFTNLKGMIESTTKRQFNVSHFQQLLNLAPQFFNHRWEMRHGKMEVIILHPSNVDEIANAKYNKGEDIKASETIHQGRISGETIKLRQKIIRQELIKFMADQLEERYVDSGFDAYNSLQWPPYFNIEDIDDIQLAELKEQPKTVQKHSIKDFLQANDTKAEVMRAIEANNRNSAQQQAQQVQQQTTVPIAQAQRVDNDTSQISASSSDSDDGDSSEEAIKRQKNQPAHGIQQKTLEAIQIKQKIEKDAKENNQEIMKKQEAQKKIDLLYNISQQIKSITQFKPESTTFLSKLLEIMMQGANRGMFISKEHLKDQIVELTKACPKWISIVKHQMGTMIKVHQNLNHTGYQIKQNIQDYFLGRKQETNIVQPIVQNQRQTNSVSPQSYKKNTQGIQVYNKTSSFQAFQNRSHSNSLSQDQRTSLHKNMNISQPSSSADQNQKLASSRSNSGGKIQHVNQQNLFNQINQMRGGQPNYNQFMHQQQIQQQMHNQQVKQQQPQQQNTGNSVGISSSSGTFLSGPGAHSGGEASLTANDRDQHLPSKYLSPLKQQHMTSGKQSSGFRERGDSGVAGMGIQFGNDMYQGMQSNNSRGQFSNSSYGHTGYQQQNQYGHQQTGSHQNFYRNNNQKY